MSSSVAVTTGDNSAVTGPAAYRLAAGHDSAFGELSSIGCRAGAGNPPEVASEGLL